MRVTGTGRIIGSMVPAPQIPGGGGACGFYLGRRTSESPMLAVSPGDADEIQVPT